MTLGELYRRPNPWLASDREPGIAISTRLRLARNLRGAAFPGWAGEDECEKLWQRLAPVLCGLASLQPAQAVSMADLDEADRQILFERHLISREQAGKQRGSGLVLRLDEHLSAMVNEEDHLRLQCLRPGLDLAGTWDAINRLDDEIEDHIDYAFSPRYGYLTACPTNVGTGLRASVMLHLPGLVLQNEVNPIINPSGPFP